MLALGIDIGGSGIKGAIVDTESGDLVSERVRIETPSNSQKAFVLDIVRELIEQLEWSDGPIGIGFPGVIHQQIVCTAANLDPSLIGVNFGEELKGLIKGSVRVLNDADAAAYAEMRLGEGRAYATSGTVLILTIGTGIGTALFSEGTLVPNLEMGHVEYKGRQAEDYVSERARKEHDLSWKKWGKRLNGYLEYMEFLLQPDFIILGGGGIKKADKYSHHIKIATPWTTAAFGNLAGIVGVAIAAAGSSKGSS